MLKWETQLNQCHSPSLFYVFFYPVWIIYEQVMIAALDCCRDDLAWVSDFFFFPLYLLFFPLKISKTPPLTRPPQKAILHSQGLVCHPACQTRRWFLFCQETSPCLYFGKTICWRLAQRCGGEGPGKLTPLKALVSRKELSGSELYESVNAEEVFSAFLYFSLLTLPSFTDSLTPF